MERRAADEHGILNPTVVIKTRHDGITGWWTSLYLQWDHQFKWLPLMYTRPECSQNSNWGGGGHGEERTALF